MRRILVRNNTFNYLNNMNYIKLFEKPRLFQKYASGGYVGYTNSQSDGYFSRVMFDPTNKVGKEQKSDWADWADLITVTSSRPGTIVGESVVNPDVTPFLNMTLQMGNGETKSLEVDLRKLADTFASKGVPVKITSLRREGATTSNGSRSHHADGNAMDIVPVSGDFTQLLKLLRNDEEIRNQMSKLGVGYLKELDKMTLIKTGGTGAHIHIGGDREALRQFNDRA